MIRKRFAPLAATVLAVAGTALFAIVPAGAQTQPTAPGDLPDWVKAAPFTKEAFGPLQPSIGRRPAMLLETNYYAYGGTGNPFNEVELDVTLNARRFDDAVSMYLYWQNRVTGEMRYFNLPSGGFVNQEVDMFGSNGPVAVVTPNLTDFQLFGPQGALGPVPNNLPVTTGHYQFVLELRRAGGNQVVARSNAMYNWVDAVVTRGGDINASETWTSNNLYLLTSPVNFQDGTTLTLEPGTVVLGQAGQIGTLIIRRGARINAEGTSMLPIVLSSSQEVGDRAPGDWGGLVINGSAPTNQENPQGEGDSGPYGGNNPNDSSGTLRYVRVEFAGIAFTSDDELNGIAFQGVGRGTTVDHVQVHFNQDDGVEFFGGTVNAKYVLITDARDDSIDWTFGWTGKLQHVVVLQRSTQNDHGIEADNFEDNPNATPRSNPTIANTTFVGNAPVQGAADSDDGWQLRRGTQANITHSVVMNFANFGAVTSSDSPADFSNLRIRNTWFFNNGDGLSSSDEMAAMINDPANNNRVDENPGLPNPNSRIQPDIAALSSAPIRGAGALPAELRQDNFFDNVTYAGGVNPQNPWIYEGWTTFSDN